jgi:hypothetical protein
MTIMTSRGDLQKQISQVLSTVQSQGYKIEDVIPEEMQDHFQEMTSLKEARQYITEVEARERDLQVENTELLKKLEIKQAEIDNQPEEFKTRTVDLQQAKRSVDYYKGLADDSQVRVDRYQRKLADAAKQLNVTDEANRTIQRLQAELEDQRVIRVQLEQEYRMNEKIAEGKDAIIAEKDVRLASILTYLHQIERDKAQLEQDKIELTETFTRDRFTLEAAMVDNEKVSTACESLIETLEQETQSVTNAINRNTLINNAFCSTIMEQIVPLNRFYDRVHSVLIIYREFFQQLSAPNPPNSYDLPKSQLDSALNTAMAELISWQRVPAIRPDGPAQEILYTHVDHMAATAGTLYMGLEDIRDEVVRFLHRLCNDPDAQSRVQGPPALNASVRASSIASLFRFHRGGSRTANMSQA